MNGSDNQDMLYEDPSKIFVGVRFVLAGFDAVKKEQIRSKLVEGGGVDLTRYGPDCTHLIVDNIVYDDPICVAARRDGKIVVTSLWAEHSFDLGMPVCGDSIMYRPPKDLNGIPGAKSLVVCLTGYQRQDREDIMTMVELMGADFSKPLMANKVTHLICYKFEGEKYELAKRVKIKIVNHKWLEDCLRSWEILPEDDYDKSGYELEMMEAEAKDSEEEKEDIAIDRRGQKIASRGPELSKSPNQLLVKQGVSTSISQLSKFGGFSGPGNSKELSLSASKQQSKSNQVPSFEESPKMRRQMLSTNLCRTNEELLSSVPRNRSNSVFLSNSAKKSPRSSSSQETPRKFNLSMDSERIKSYAGSHPAAEAEFGGLNLSSEKEQEKAAVEFDFLNFSSEKEHENSEFGTKTPRNLSSPGKGLSNRSPGKRKMDISDSRFRSPRTSNNPESIQDGCLKENRTEELINTPKFHSAHEHCDSAISNPVTLSTRRGGSDEDALQSGPCGIIGSKEDSHVTADVDGPLEELHDVKDPSPVNERKEAEFNKSGDDSMSGSKPVKKKSISKKTLGSRKSFAKGDVRNQKGSIFTDKTILMSDPAASSSDGKEDERKTESINDDTEAPEDQEVEELNVLREKSTDNEAQHSGLQSTEKKVNAKVLNKDDVKDCAKSLITENNKAEPQKNFSPKKSKLSESTSAGEKVFTGSKYLTKNKKTSLASKRAAIATEGRDETGPQNFLSPTMAEVLPAANADSSKEIKRNKILESGEVEEKVESRNDDTEAPEDQEDEELNVLRQKSSDSEEVPRSRVKLTKRKVIANKVLNKDDAKDCAKSLITENKSETRKNFSAKKTKLSESTSMGEKVLKGLNYLTKSKKTSLAPKRAAIAVEGREDTFLQNAEIERNKILESGKEAERKTDSVNDDTEAPEDREDEEFTVPIKKSADTKAQRSGLQSAEKKLNATKVGNQDEVKEQAKSQIIENNKSDTRKNASAKKARLSESTSVGKASEEKVLKGSNPDREDEEKSADTEAQRSGFLSAEKKLNANMVGNQDDVKEQAKSQIIENNKSETRKNASAKKTRLSESTSVGKVSEEKVLKGSKNPTKSKKTSLASKRAAISTEGAEKKKRKTDRKKLESSMDLEKENIPVIGVQNVSHNGGEADRKSPYGRNARSLQVTEVGSEPRCFIVSGHRLQRKEFQQVIKRLKGKVCRDSHQWSYQATHFIVPAPLRRTEKFFAAASSGRWILKTDYLTACSEAGKLLDEEPYEWHKKGLTEDLAINLEAPRKWRLLRERTGHGALYGMRIIIYGDCIVPSLDTLKRAVKAGDGTILATSPPYSRFLESGVDFAIVSEIMPRCDKWVQEFLRHEIPCVLPDYLVTYVCKPGYPLSNYVQYNTHTWAETSLKKHANRLEEIVEEMAPSDDDSNDLACQVCGSTDREEVMLVCGDESGSCGCGIGMHVDCCDPPLECIPEEDWFCPECSKKDQSNTSTKRKSTKGTSTSKRRKK